MTVLDRNKALPKVKRIIIIVAIILVSIIFIAQSYQDIHRKQVNLDAERIHLYHQETTLMADFMSSLSFRRLDNDIATDNFSQELLKIIKDMMFLQEKMQKEKSIRHFSDNSDISTYEQNINSYVESSLLMANEIMALAEAGEVTNTIISTFYKNSLPEYRLFQNESRRLIDKLSTNHQKISESDRSVLWMIVNFIIVIVILTCFALYKYISYLLNARFKLIAQDIQLRSEREKIALEHANLMHEQQMKMRSILDHNVDSIITITADGKIDSFNKTAEKMFGYSVLEVMGKNVKLLMPENYAKQHDGFLKHYMQTGVRKVIGIGREVIAQRKDESQFPMYLSVSEVPDSNPRLFTGIIHDMTEWNKKDASLKQTLAELRLKQEQLEEEEKIACHVFANITENNNNDLPEVSSWIVPMGAFSGDMMLSSVMPSGAIRVILCDFTGHGLPAALGAVPVSSIYKALAQKDLPLEVLMDELNTKLNELLPTGIFCCIAGIDIDATRTHAHIWNAGLPEVLLVTKSGEIKQRIKSDHLPLGVMEYEENEMHSVHVQLEVGDSLYLYSDGMTEAENPAGEMYGEQRLEALLALASEDGDRMNTIQNTLKDYINNAPAADDLSIVQIKTLVIADEIILES